MTLLILDLDDVRSAEITHINIIHLPNKFLINRISTLRKSKDSSHLPGLRPCQLTVLSANKSYSISSTVDFRWITLDGDLSLNWIIQILKPEFLLILLQRIVYARCFAQTICHHFLLLLLFIHNHTPRKYLIIARSDCNIAWTPSPSFSLSCSKSFPIYKWLFENWKPIL